MDRAHPEPTSAGIAKALARATAALLAERNAAGHWSGELSGSALSTAVATIALGEIDQRSGTNSHARWIEGGLNWLAKHANPDGGWGDTIRSRSNLSTTALVWAAFGAAGADASFSRTVREVEDWIRTRIGSTDRLVPAIEADYGSDRTFSVPIVMTLALSGRLGADGWRQVRPLPFELAALPRAWFGALQLPVVSYALPALIAIGQAIHHHAPSASPIARKLRNATREHVLRRLETLQPENGGFLEATPLTAFVTMSLASTGHGHGLVAKRSAEFLRASVRPDGSWPIDTNLATWLTTLAIKALAHQPTLLSESDSNRLRAWLLKQQYRITHPYTGAAPGGWAWTDLPGGVPDADDTAGALLALRRLGVPDAETLQAAAQGARWLLDLQNRDGGIPTFCRGWGTLPFDRSAPELTAHALRAWLVWRPLLEPDLVRGIDRAQPRAMRFLKRNQRDDGAWVPLWFGNEHTVGQQNPVYGTAQVLIALNEMAEAGVLTDDDARQRAAGFLLNAQDQEGGWGGDARAPVSIEETALAVEALCALPEHRAAVRRGIDRLLAFVEGGLPGEPAPIGLYFARLWYFERLYPLLFTTSALGRFASNNPQP
jgi:squalene-hopene/tetraprenyl-beta-curcumene cyclase